MSLSISQKIDQAASSNAAFLQTLSETDNAPASLEQQIRLLNDLDALLKESGKTRVKLVKARDKELKDHEKYRDSTARRFFHKAVGKSAQFTEKAAKEEREYFEALQDLHREDNTADSLRAQIQEATAVKDQYQADVDRRQQAQRDLDALYSDIFGGATAEYPEEDSKERASDAALASYHDKRTELETEKQIARHIREANDQLKLALGQMDQALSYSQADIIGFDSGAYMKRNCLHKAEMYCAEARMRTMRAQTLNPAIRNLPDVNIDQGSIMMDVVFDNIFSDMDFHDKIKTSKRSIETCQRALTETSAECVARQEALIEELNIRQTVLSDTREALQQERAAIFAMVLSKKAPTGDAWSSFVGDEKA
ncbi:hypothetical protein F5X68DRAFT_277265 [Plectosphaerella plurivora]|uniref:Uncharacterized protein n=1 Tax=Plectosphaerella plurivora TaxID=936078 RepID=A0A9P8VA02_9PEZI|nr:hypothetical protein F5X68DRAFT_277265 [Plectosphaerella plurivora]